MRELRCGIYRSSAGFEVQCAYGPHDLLRSQMAPEIGKAREIGAQWRQAVIAKGGFLEVLNDGGDGRMGG
jgi:hypothetical protein